VSIIIDAPVGNAERHHPQKNEIYRLKPEYDMSGYRSGDISTYIMRSSKCIRNCGNDDGYVRGNKKGTSSKA